MLVGGHRLAGGVLRPSARDGSTPAHRPTSSSSTTGPPTPLTRAEPGRPPALRPRPQPRPLDDGGRSLRAARPAHRHRGRGAGARSRPRRGRIALGANGGVLSFHPESPMKRPTSLLALVSLTLAAASAFAASAEWEDPRVFAIGTEKPHATLVPFADREAALVARPREVVPRARPERDLEVQVAEEPLRGPGRIRDAGLRRRRAGTTSRCPPTGRWSARGRGARTTSPSSATSSTRSRPTRRACRTTTTRPASTAPRFVVPEDAGGSARLPALRGRAVRVLRLGQRTQDRLPRGRLHAGRVRRDGCREAGRQPARGRGHRLLGRHLPGGPGLLALRRHLPRRVPRDRGRRSTCATSR